MKLEDYRRWLALARRFSRRPGEAEDLVQAGLVAALEAGRLDLDGPENDRWFAGVLRKQAALQARREGRRRKRERHSAVRESRPSTESPPQTASVVAGLPQGVRVVAALALTGMTREEITQALALTPAAFRQRLTSLRRALDGLSSDLRQEALASAGVGPPASGDDLEFGLIRRALVAYLRQVPGIGLHDPDGHLFVVRTSQALPPRQPRGKETED